MAATIVKKADAAGKVHMGISEIYAVVGGFTVTEGAVDLTKVAKILNYPVEQGSFNYNGGTPSINHFHVYGQTADWASSKTPGDSSIEFNVPTYETNVLESLGFKQTDLEIKGAGDITGDSTMTSLKGKSFAQTQKAVHLGIIGVSEDGASAVFIKDTKLYATVMNDDSNKPLYVKVSGSLANGGDPASMAIMEPATASA